MCFTLIEVLLSTCYVKIYVDMESLFGWSYGTNIEISRLWAATWIDNISCIKTHPLCPTLTYLKFLVAEMQWKLSSDCFKVWKVSSNKTWGDISSHCPPLKMLLLSFSRLLLCLTGITMMKDVVCHDRLIWPPPAPLHHRRDDVINSVALLLPWCSARKMDFWLSSHLTTAGHMARFILVSRQSNVLSS